MFPFAVTASSPRGARAAPITGSPGLRDAGERLAASLVKALQAMAGESTTVEGQVGAMVTMPLRDVIAAHRAETVAATIGCSGPPCTLLVTLDPVLVHTLVELLTGGDGSEPPPDAARPVTAVDAQFTQILATLIASTIEREWEGFGPAKAQRQEGALPLDVCGPRLSSVAVVTLLLTIFGHRGTVLLALPPAALAAFPQPEAPVAAKPADPQWREGLRRGLGRAPLRVEAFMDAKALSLGTIASLAVGDVIELVPMAGERVSLVCDERTFYRGELGLSDDGFSVRVSEPAARSVDAPRASTRPTPVKADA